MVERAVTAEIESLSLVVFAAAKSAVETPDWAGREFPLLSETTPVCMSCNIIPSPAFYNTKFDRKTNLH